MSEENKDMLLPEEENEKKTENQSVEKETLSKLTVEEQQILESDEAIEEKSENQIIDEIDSKIAEQSEEEDLTERIDFDISKIRNFSLKELVEEFRDILDNQPVEKAKKILYKIKEIFDEKWQQAKEEALAKYVEENGSEQGFNFRSPEKEEMQGLFREFKRRIKESYERYRKRLIENQQKREEILEELKALIDGQFQGSYKEIYQRFKELRQKWFETGPVPRDKYNHLWNSFRFQVERFYDLIDLDKEYRSKLYEENLKEKQKIIDRAKELLEKEDVLEAFRELQFLHKVWKEKTGPVEPAIKEKIWEEFKSLTKQIHDKRREYFAKLREEYEKNLERKKEIIQKLDNILQEEVTEHRRWQELVQEVEKIKEEFRNAGFVPLKYRDEIRNAFYEKVRTFNRAKNAYYKGLKEIQKENLRKKKALIEQAKQLAEEEDAKSAFEKCRELQKQWREIGFVPKRVSEKIWKEFREVCDRVYENYKSEVRKEMEEEYQNFLKKKEYLAQLKAQVKEGKIEDLNIEKIQSFLEEWKSLGQVPENVRYINSKFNRFINSLFYKLNIDENELRMMQFKNQVENWIESGDQGKIRREINFLRNKINEIESEIRNMETNMHFFKSSDENNAVLKRLNRELNQKKRILKLNNQKLEYLRSLDI